jgi:hypothetical protein
MYSQNLLHVVAWLLTPAPYFAFCLKEWETSAPDELANMLSNFLIVHQLLINGVNAASLRANSDLVHEEKGGVLAVDDRGCVKIEEKLKFRFGRLYFFPDGATKVVHMISIGDNQTHEQDVNTAVVYTDGLKKNRETRTGIAS